MKLIQPVERPGGLRAAGAIHNDLAIASIWAWYRSNPDRVVAKIGGFLKIRVKDLRFLFELLAGPEPQ